MKKLLLTIFCGIATFSCNKASTEAGGGLPPPNLLLSNQTFDDGSNASLNGWTYARSDVDSVAHFSTDIPPGSSGKWSLSLSPGWVPSTEYVYRNFIGLTSGIYKLTVWVKVLGNHGGGELLISSKPLQPWKPLTSSSVSDTIWKQITLLDTLTFGAADTTSLIFTGGATEVANWSVLYNNITFERLP